jgi:glutamate racemase
LAPVTVIGVIEPGARAGIAATRNKRIAVIATESTVKGGAYSRAIHDIDASVEVMQRPAQVFVALAEEGWTDSAVTLAAARAYLAPLFEGRPAPDTLVLGCTHFPVLVRSIREAIGDKVTIVDSAATAAASVADALAAQGVANEETIQGVSRFLATDSPERFARVGEIFLGRKIEAKDVELIDLRPST